MFPGVFRSGRLLYTENLVPGQRVYGEKLLRKGKEYREWDPSRSKLGAALLKGLKNMPICKESKVLYLGASTGTTVSHVSDITREGIVYAVEFAERVFHPLLELQKKRKNIAPILADARKPEEYGWIEECDVLFCDIAQPDQSLIAIRNAKMLVKKGGIMMLVVKSQSIDVTKDPIKVYKEEETKLIDAGFTLLETIRLEPYEEKHAMIVARVE